MEINIILIILLAIGVYIFLDSYLKTRTIEKFEQLPADTYLDNDIKDILEATSKTLDEINIIKPLDKDRVFAAIKNQFNNNQNESNDIYEKGKKYIDDSINNLNTKVSGLINENHIMLPTKKIVISSIKSNQNSQALNVTNLKNDKYLVNVNGKCLQTNALAKTNIQPCNEDDPGQYFELNFIANKNDYQNNINTVGQTYKLDTHKFQYPFTILKSVANGNCLTNNDSILSVVPCQPNISQHWSISTDPIKCTYEQV
jgi:hypothetical protein